MRLTLRQERRLHMRRVNRFFYRMSWCVRLEVLPEGKAFFPKLNRFDPKERAENVMLVDLARNPALSDAGESKHLSTAG